MNRNDPSWEKERRWIEAKIRGLESMIREARPDNPDIPRWKEEINGLRAQLNSYKY